VRQGKHIPLIVGSPGDEGSIEAGRRDDAMVGLVDPMPTLLSACDVPIPDLVQGRDLTDHLYGEAIDAPDSVYLQSELAGDGWRAIRTPEYLFTVDRRLQPRELFDVTDDPYRQRNLLDERSDLPADLLEQLIARADEFDDHQITSWAFRRGMEWGPRIDLATE
jgi:arylsulfatase A-like enzyme